jgi:conflict system STAND superfamily ATPase
VSDPVLIDADRPWPGLLPFTEDASQYFHGREHESDELFRLIERETLTVLFGQSGLGKSSLLNAGVFPRLRRAGYLPVYLRLDLDARAPALLDQVARCLVEACRRNEVIATPQLPGETFWEYLHRPDTQFLNPHGRPVVPTLVLDQFEEIFTLGRQSPEQTLRTQTFIQQLGELIENRVPQELETALTLHPERLDQLDLLRQNLKIVFAFREDYLAEFEELKSSIRPIMQNRMRLTAMRGDRAAEAIQTAGAGRVSASVAARIVRFLGGAPGAENQRLEDIAVEPALLSLVCRELNEQRIARGQSEITADLIQGENAEQIIARFYEQGFVDLDPRVRQFVEDHLLTAAGYRDSCALDNALAAPGVTQTALQILADRRILRREERGGLVRLELIHDVLAAVAKQSRAARHQAESLAAAQLLVAKQRRRQRFILASAGVLVACLVGVSWIAWTAIREKRAAETATQNARDAAAAKEFERQAAEKATLIAKQANETTTRTLQDKETERRAAIVNLAAADEQLDKHGTVEEQRKCVQSTTRVAAGPAPEATVEYFVGTWHVDNEVSSTYVEWRPDHSCVTKHIINQGKQIDTSGDMCTWSFKRLGPHAFAIDWTSKVLGDGFPKHLEFEIKSPLRVHNATMNYDSFRIVCPAQEIELLQRQLTALKQRSDANPGNSAFKDDLAAEFEKLGQAQDQADRPEQALAAFTSEIAIYRQLLTLDPANLVWREHAGAAEKNLGAFHMSRFQALRARNPSGTPEAVAELRDAFASYQSDLSIRTKLAAAAPQDLDALRAEAMANWDVGLVLSWYQFAQCRTYFLENVRILEKVTAAPAASEADHEALMTGWWTLSQVSDGPAKREAVINALKIAEVMDRDHQLTGSNAGVIETLRQQLTAIDTAKRNPGP